MKIIIEPNLFILKTLGQSKIKKESSYRRFTYSFLMNKEKNFLFYNMLTREMISLTEDEYTSILKNEYDDINFLEYLISNWFLVEEKNDDKQIVQQVQSILKLIEKNNNNNKFNFFTILPTTDCNARCFYCYEANIEKKNMSKETAEDIVSYITKNYNNQKVSIRWFGGEPLYNIEAIDTITFGLKKNNVDFSSSMVSNGYLFSEDVIYKAKNQWNLTFVQITLDGTEKVYNRCKNYIYPNSISPYKVVINNIKSLVFSNVFVSIRLNLNPHNFQDLKNLVEELYLVLENNPNYSIYVHLLFEDSGNLKLNYNEEEKKIRFQQLFELENIIKDKGIYLRKKLSNKPKMRMCMADDDSAIVILPDGKLSKCEHALYKETVGNIYDDKLDYDAISTWKKRITELEKCKDCPIYPDCIKLEKCISDEKKCGQLEQLSAIRRVEYTIWQKYQDKEKTDSEKK